MSAAILEMPERDIRPNCEGARRLVDMRPRGDFDWHMVLAGIGLESAEKVCRKYRERGGTVPRRDHQRVMDGLFLSWFALSEILGVPRDLIFDDEPDGAA